jgi:hypothetical protein
MERCAKVLERLLPPRDSRVGRRPPATGAKSINHADAKDFMLALKVADATDVLYRLSKKGQDGCTFLRDILGASTCFEEVVLPFIIWLGQDLLSKGSFARVQ